MSEPRKALVACEWSGTLRRALRAEGIDAYSVDITEAADGSEYHIIGDAIQAAHELKWDALLAFPPCRFLCSSGLHWNKRRPERAAKTEAALQFVRDLMDAPIHYMALENSVGCISTRIRKPDQIIQPWQFGHPESKATCLWLRNLPKLQPTDVLPLPESGRWENQTPSGQNKLGPSPERSRLRGKTYEGIAAAMAQQWAPIINGPIGGAK